MFVLLVRYHTTHIIDVEVEPCLSDVVQHLEECGVRNEDITENLKQDIYWYRGQIADVIVCRKGSYDSSKLKVWLT